VGARDRVRRSAGVLGLQTFRAGLYSSHFGEVRGDVGKDLVAWEKRDPLKKMTEWLIDHGLASAEDLERVSQQEEQRIEDTLREVLAETASATKELG
jgi:TPP-dependent pyruvate/acetoin dehydrogenase alpha subunit